MSDKEFSKELVEAAVSNDLHANVFYTLKYINNLLYEMAMGVELAVEQQIPLPISLLQESFETLFIGLNHAKEFNDLAMEQSKTVLNEFKVEQGVENIDFESPEYAALKELVINDPRMVRLALLLSEDSHEAKERLTKEASEKGVNGIQEYLRKIAEGQKSNDQTSN